MKIRQRQYGKQPFKVSEIGLGGHREGVDTRAGIARTAHFFRTARERALVVRRVIELGTTYFDTTYGCELRSLGESFRRNAMRDGLFVSAMRVDFFANLAHDALGPREYTRREIKSRQHDFGHGALDQFILGAIEGGDPLAMSRETVEEALAEIARMRQEGIVRHLGFSCHDPEYAARFLDAFPVFDAVMVPYSFANRVAEGAFTEAVRRHGVAWIAMKSLVWQVYGVPVTALKLLTPEIEGCPYDPTAPVARLALQFILGNEMVATIVPAVNTEAEAEENAAASSAGSLDESGWKHLGQYAAASSAERSVPLAIAGLLVDNLRVRSCAIGHLHWALSLPPHGINWEGDDAEERARHHARYLVAQLRHDARWSPLLRDNEAVQRLMSK